MLKSMETLLKIVTHQQSWWFCICGQSPMILATPQGVGTVWHSQRAYTHRKAANGQSFYFNWGAHDLSLVFTPLLIQAFPKTIFYKSVSRILFICRFCFFYWTLKLFRYLRLSRGSTTIITTSKLVVCTAPKRAPYRHSPCKGHRIIVSHHTHCHP